MRVQARKKAAEDQTTPKRSVSAGRLSERRPVTTADIHVDTDLRTTVEESALRTAEGESALEDTQSVATSTPKQGAAPAPDVSESPLPNSQVSFQNLLSPENSSLRFPE